MKHTAILFCLAWLAIASQAADELSPAARHAEAAKLLDGLPSRSDLYHADAILHKGLIRSEIEREIARKTFEVAKERIPKLRPLITVGDSVFDYPGLLAAGEPQFVKNRGEHPDVKGKYYRLFIGITEQTEEGHIQIPNMFGIEFDQSGRILRVLGPGTLIL
ncbi:hypothetical protein [Prosthecobacter sp.]|uniref:hypothetical protein n=1 Tax=Prosthecobacter sp. TaxID=1965333 RepID=UPI00378462CF